jgi:hypothetical protein
LRVILKVFVSCIYQGVIRYVGEGQLFQHIFFYEPCNHIIRRYDHIDICAAHPQQRIHLLIALVLKVVDLDTRFFFKHAEDTRIDILAPVIYIYLTG